MKLKIFIIILGLLISSICYSQDVKRKSFVFTNSIETKTPYVPSPDTIPLVSVSASTSKNGWAVEGNTCTGCPSYFYKIIRSKYSYKAEDGNTYFYFYFYFFSNSFLTNGTYTGTYLSNISFYVDGLKILNIPYVLLEPKQIICAAWIRSLNYSSSVSYEISNIRVY